MKVDNYVAVLLPIRSMLADNYQNRTNRNDASYFARQCVCKSLLIEKHEQIMDISPDLRDRA